MSRRAAFRAARFFAAALGALALALLGAAHRPAHPGAPAALAAYSAPDGGVLDHCLSEAAPPDDARDDGFCPACVLIAGAAPPPPAAAPPPSPARAARARPRDAPALAPAGWRPDKARGPPVLSV